MTIWWVIMLGLYALAIIRGKGFYIIGGFGLFLLGLFSTLSFLVSWRLKDPLEPVLFCLVTWSLFWHMCCRYEKGINTYGNPDKDD